MMGAVNAKPSGVKPESSPSQLAKQTIIASDGAIGTSHNPLGMAHVLAIAEKSFSSKRRHTKVSA
jgi:hypothetical protein